MKPDVDVEEAPPATGGRVAALQGEPGVGGRQEGDVLDGVLDVEVFQGGDVEVGGVEVGLDQPRQDGPAPGVDARCVGGQGGGAGDGPGVGDPAVVDDQGGVGDGRRARAVDELAVGDDRGAGGGLHGVTSERSQRLEEPGYEPGGGVGGQPVDEVADPRQVDGRAVGQRPG